MAHRRVAPSPEPTLTDDAVVDGYLARYPEIARLAHAVYTPEGVRLFMTTPMPRFDGRTAIELIDAGQDDRVLSALGADYEGLS
jgi:hypothetical protein